MGSMVALVATATDGRCCCSINSTPNPLRLSCNQRGARSLILIYGKQVCRRPLLALIAARAHLIWVLALLFTLPLVMRENRGHD